MDFGIPSLSAVPWLFPVFAILHFVIVLIVAFAVQKDAVQRQANHRGLFLVGPWLWFFVTLTIGFVGALAYWLIHYSSLRYRHDEKA